MTLLRQVLASITVSTLISCSDLGQSDPMFGANYFLLQTVDYPSLQADSLFLRVGYSGCSGNHPFLLHYRIVAASSAEIWLFKDDREEPCDGFIEETKIVLLPQEIGSRQNLVLLGPRNIRITLR